MTSSQIETDDQSKNNEKSLEENNNHKGLFKMMTKSEKKTKTKNGFIEAHSKCFGLDLNL